MYYPSNIILIKNIITFISTLALVLVGSCSSPQKNNMEAEVEVLKKETDRLNKVVEEQSLLIDTLKSKMKATLSNYEKLPTAPKNPDLIISDTNSQLRRSIYSNIDQTHVKFEGYGITYEVSLNMKPVGGKRSDQFYHSQAEQTIISGPMQSHGGLPCSPPCIPEIYAHTINGAFRIQTSEMMTNTVNGFCGDPGIIFRLEHSALDTNVLYTGTFKGTSDNSFLKASDLRMDKPPIQLSPDSFAIPKGFKNKEVEFYKYGNSEAFLVFVRANGWVESDDEDKFGLSKEGKWEAIYFASESGVKIITPASHSAQFYFGESLQTPFGLIGLEDINDDGELDIIIGRKRWVTLVLERYKNGFRSWAFPFDPAGGC